MGDSDCDERPGNSASNESKHLQRVAPMQATDAIDAQPRRIPADAQRQRLAERIGEAGKLARVTGLDSRRRLDFDERRPQARTFDDEIDFGAAPVRR